MTTESAMRAALDGTKPREFSSADELRRHYAGVIARTKAWKAPKKPVQAVSAPEAISVPPEPTKAILAAPGPVLTPISEVAAPVIDPRLIRRDWIFIGGTIHPSLKLLLATVAELSGVTINELTSARRTRPLPDHRFAYYYLARAFTANSYPQIGLSCGNRDHSSVHHGVKSVQNNYEKYRVLIEGTVARLGISAVTARLGEGT